LLKILFIHEVSYRKKVIFEMHEFPELLALRGHEISFLEFDEGRKFWKPPKAPRFEKINGRVHEEAAIRLFRPCQLGIPGLDRILTLVTVIPVLRKLFRENNFDIVVLYAVPTFGLQTLWLAKRNRVPVLFRALDVSHKIRNSVLSPLIKWWEMKVYRRADLLSANNPSMAAYCSSIAGRSLNTVVHYPPLDLTHFQSGTRDHNLRESLGFRDRDRVIVYLGSFFYFSGLVSAIHEFANCVKKNEALKFLLVGGGELDLALRKLVKSLRLENNVVFTGFISYQNLPSILKIADVAVNTLESSLVSDTALPNKVLQYLAAGLPVVSTRLSGLHSVFDSKASITWESDATSVISKAARLTSSDVKQMQISTTSRVSLSKFEPKRALDEIEETLLDLKQATTR
jgi:glycosyltransferase involved in cell wall biosynthesis